MSLDDEGDGQELDLDAVTDGFDISIEGTIASAMGLTEDGSPSMPSAGADMQHFPGKATVLLFTTQSLRPSSVKVNPGSLRIADHDVLVVAHVLLVDAGSENKPRVVLEPGGGGERTTTCLLWALTHSHQQAYGSA